MEEELNYLSDKIEEVEHCINLVEFGIPLGMHTKSDIQKLKKDKEILENIINVVTINELK